MGVLKVISIIILLIGFSVTIKNLFLIIEGKMEQSLIQIVLNFVYTIIPMIYIYLS